MASPGENRLGIVKLHPSSPVPRAYAAAAAGPRVSSSPRLGNLRAGEPFRGALCMVAAAAAAPGRRSHGVTRFRCGDSLRAQLFRLSIG